MDNWENRLLCFIIIFHLSTAAFSQIENERSISFFNHLYDFEFAKADSLISTIDSTEESSTFNFLKVHYLRWYHLPIHKQNPSILDLYNTHLTASEYNEKSRATDYTQINSALLRAEFNYNQGNYYKSFQNGSKVYDVVKDNLEVEPQQIELKFLVSLYHYYYQYYKNENPVFGTMMWFFKEGNKETGLKWLEEVVEQESIVNTEALIYLSHIYLRLENKPQKAYNYAEKLYDRFPNNLKFYELLIESSLANKIENDLLPGLIDELKNSEKSYFKKYGVCYNAVFSAKFGNQNQDEKILLLKNALTYIQKKGGGNHLSSLLYQSLYALTGDAEYLKQKNKIESYKYVLTGYPEEHSN
ncbi:MAG: hypothetical protein ACQETL_15060 [Bacteroidota bacterium]